MKGNVELIRCFVESGILPSYCFSEYTPHYQGHLKVQSGCSGHHICIPASRKPLSKKIMCLRLSAASAYISLARTYLHDHIYLPKVMKMKSLFWAAVWQGSHSVSMRVEEILGQFLLLSLWVLHCLWRLLWLKELFPLPAKVYWAPAIFTIVY